MWAKNFIDEKKLSEEIRKTLRELGETKPRCSRDLKNEVIRRMELFAEITVRDYYKQKQKEFKRENAKKTNN